MSKQLSSVARPTLVPFPVDSAVPADALDSQTFFKVESYARGSVICRPGEPATRLYLVRSGRVRLLRPLNPGAKGLPAGVSVHALLHPGDLFGEILRPVEAAVEDFAVADSEVELWSMEGRDLRGLVEARPPLALEIIRGLSERVRSMRLRLNALTFKEVPARLAEALLVLGESHGEHCQHGGEVDLRGITQQDLADMVGASRSFVSTLINEMKRDGLLGNVGRVLCLRNQRELRRLASKDRV